MINALNETIISLADAAKCLPKRRGGKRPHLSCIYRWTVSGCRGIKLESIQIGGTRCTSREALGRFFERLSQAAGCESGPTNVRTPGQRNRASAQAEHELKQAGF